MNSPTISDVEREARELLAAAYRAEGFEYKANLLLNQERDWWYEAAAIRALLTALSAQKSEREEAHDLRDALDRLGYDRVFRAIGDAVKIEYGTALAISVEKLIAGLTGIPAEEARHLSALRNHIQGGENG